jgi:hypothetical protein
MAIHHKDTQIGVGGLRQDNGTDLGEPAEPISGIRLPGWRDLYRGPTMNTRTVGFVAGCIFLLFMSNLLESRA